MLWLTLAPPLRIVRASQFENQWCIGSQQINHFSQIRLYYSALIVLPHGKILSADALRNLAPTFPCKYPQIFPVHFSQLHVLVLRFLKSFFLSFFTVILLRWFFSFVSVTVKQPLKNGQIQNRNCVITIMTALFRNLGMPDLREVIQGLLVS